MPLELDPRYHGSHFEHNHWANHFCWCCISKFLLHIVHTTWNPHPEDFSHCEALALNADSRPSPKGHNIEACSTGVFNGYFTNTISYVPHRCPYPAREHLTTNLRNILQHQATHAFWFVSKDNIPFHCYLHIQRRWMWERLPVSYRKHSLRLPIPHLLPG